LRHEFNLTGFQVGQVRFFGIDQVVFSEQGMTLYADL
jgi:hypothetical protein